MQRTRSNSQETTLALIELFLVQFALSGDSPAGFFVRNPVIDSNVPIQRLVPLATGKCNIDSDHATLVLCARLQLLLALRSGHGFQG